MEKIIKIITSKSTVSVEGKSNPNVKKIFLKLGKYLKKNSLKSEIIEIENKKIFFAKSKNFGEKPSVIFQAHIDTVPAKNTDIKIKNGYLVGRGVVDMKGSLIGMIEAFSQITKMKNPKYEVGILITEDEEVDLKSAQNIIKKRRDVFQNVELIINGEPSNFEVKNLFRGLLYYQIIAKKQPEHSAYMEDKSTAEKFLELTPYIKKLLTKTKKKTNKKFGKGESIMTRVGYEKINNKDPEYFDFAFNIYTVKPNEIYKKIFNRELGRFLGSEYKIKKMEFEPCECILSKDISKKIQTAFRENKMKIYSSPVKFLTESSIFNMAKIPTINFGVGKPNLAHKKYFYEKIKISDIKKYADILQSFYS